MAQLENIEAIEKRLWNAADTLRSNSNYASNEYFLPVMGLIFLRHAYSRYLSVKDDIKVNLPKRGGKRRSLTKEDFSQKSSIFLKKESQFDYLVSLRDSDNRAKAVIEAMESIEADYETLRGVLPKNEYQELDNEVLGRIYEYFLTQFADQKAHDGGEFFTPISLVSLIANVLEPKRGVVLDPACGSGGMFVQSAHFVERMKANPSERLTFYGLEKNQTTINLAKMNLAVHGLEGDIQKAITYYEDPHELVGKADFVLANPPFNVDEVDADKVKRDPRLPFGLPGVNKGGKVSNGNYLWISYFYSYLNEKGRAGFVMSSQASSAGRDEAKVRQKLVETGHVDIMISIRSNFFYTRTVPCELWFLNRNKPKKHQDKVLMLDARNVFRKVTRKIYDFSPEQQQNLLAIIWLYRGEGDRFLDLVARYLEQTLDEAAACLKTKDEGGKVIHPLADLETLLATLPKTIQSFLKTVETSPVPQGGGPGVRDALEQLNKAGKIFSSDVPAFEKSLKKEQGKWKNQVRTNASLNKAVPRIAPLAETSRDLIKQADLLYKLASRAVEALGGSPAPATDNGPRGRGPSLQPIKRLLKEIDGCRQVAVTQLKQVRYFHKQAVWLTDRFPKGELCDVEGLVKLVDKKELEANDWSLTPGRYVGVAPEEEDGDFDFEEALRDIHVELEGLNGEAVELAAKIKKNFEELGI